MQNKTFGLRNIEVQRFFYEKNSKKERLFLIRGHDEPVNLHIIVMITSPHAIFHLRGV